MTPDDFWRSDLVSAGWREKSHTIWIDAQGRLWRGPYGAWLELQRRKQAEGRQ